MKNGSEKIIGEITAGSLHKSIAVIGIPAALSSLMGNFYAFNDFFWLKFAPDFICDSGQAALSGIFYLVIVNGAIGNLIAFGAIALVARSSGARDDGSVSFFTRQAAVWALIVAAIAAVLQFVYARDIMQMIFAGGCKPETIEAGVNYIRIYSAGIPALIFCFVGSAIFRARGDAKTPFLIDLFTIVLNAGLTPLFLLQFEWGMEGVALGMIISRTAAAAIYAGCIYSGKLGVPVSLVQNHFPDLRTFYRFIRIGVPMAVSTLAYALIGIVIGWLVQHFGQEAYTGGIGIGMRNWESLSYNIMFGISAAANTIVGQNLGAGKPERAEKAAWLSAGYAGLVGLFFTGAFQIFAGPLSGVYTENPEIARHTADYISIIGLSQVFLGVQFAITGAFSGAGNTLPPMIIGVVMTAARIPAAYFVAFGTIAIPVIGETAGWNFGSRGIWFAMTAGTVLHALILAALFKRGQWKEFKV